VKVLNHFSLTLPNALLVFMLMKNGAKESKGGMKKKRSWKLG
jgi:hypothetical protein